MTSSEQAQEKTFSWAWPAFDLFYLFVMFVTATVREGGRDIPGPELTALALLAWLPLLFRHHWPEAALALVVFVEAIHIAFGVSIGPNPNANEAMGAFQPVPLGTIAASFTLAAKRYGRAGWGPGVAAGVVLLAVGIAAQGQQLLVTCFVVLDLVLLATGAGVLVSHRRERIARDERDRVAEIRGEVVAERMRIAQDLHDVLAHHLTLVNAQAGVADYLLRTDPDAASGALRDIAGNTRRALDELRATVGLLREAGPDDPLRPAPGLDQFDDLLAGFRKAGADVVATTTGVPVDLTAGKDLAAYRIVQEAVTNATKHAPGAPVNIDLPWGESTLTLRITNPEPPGLPSGHQGPGTRHGLIGMRERAVTAGGTLNAGPAPSGGFAVIATIPLRNESPA